MRPVQGEAVDMAIDQVDLRLLPLRTPTAPAVNRMAASLRARGQLTPIIVTQDTPVLVDGFKRIQAARILGMTALKAVSLNVDPVKAKAMMYLMNRSGGFSIIQEALLVRELVDTDGLSQKEAAQLLERHKSWVNRRLLMIRRLAPEIIDDLKLQLIPPGSAFTLARVPPCNQPDLSIAIQTHRLSAKQTASLVNIWCKATDTGVKHCLMQSPREAIKIILDKPPQQRMIRQIQRLLGIIDRQFHGNDAIKPHLIQVQSGLMAIHQALVKENP
jgi:ParB-like chromosome segregation protein Spo0J